MVTGTKITAVLPLVGNYHLQRAQGLRAWGTLPASARTHTLLSIRLEHSQAGMIVRIFTYLPISSRATPHCAAAAKSFQLCPTLCDPIDSSPQGSSVPGILQARVLEWGCHFLLQCMKVKSESEVAQSHPTLCDPMDCSPPGSSIHGIFQAGVLEWGASATPHCSPC